MARIEAIIVVHTLSFRNE